MSRIDCNEAMERLNDYLKKELTPDLATEIRQHLERCSPCFSHAKFEANFLALLETKGRREACPAKVRARILEALRAEARKH
jgi:anti-sigma factor (TIGR02949 family)